MLTLRELVRDLGLTIRTAEEGLATPVRWVHLSELTDPTPWLSGGELLLTTGLALTTPKEQREFVARLAERGIAALGFGSGVVHKGVPRALLGACEQRGLPLIEIPYEVPFIAVTERAFARLVNEQYALLQRSVVVQQELQQIVLREGGLGEIAAALAARIDGSVLVFDGRGRLLASGGPHDDALAAAAGAELHERKLAGETRGFVPALSAGALALPVAASAGGAPQAWLTGIKRRGAPTDFDRAVLHQGVTVVALELLRRHVAAATERRLSGDVLHQIVTGELAGEELVRRLAPFGLGDDACALVLEPLSREHDPLSGATGPEPCAAALDRALQEESIAGLVAIERGRVCALLPGTADEELFRTGERLLARVVDHLGGRVPVCGAGRAVPLTQIRRAYQEARCAMEADLLGAGTGSSRADAEPHLATYRDLGSFQFLLALQDSDALRLYCDSLLGPIEAGEGHYGGELARSLEAFIACNGQWEAAARRLYCHRHTLRYRIRKVEELTGRDLGNARDRIEFWLALRARELADAQSRPALPA